jgi:hypothetical protein
VSERAIAHVEHRRARCAFPAHREVPFFLRGELQGEIQIFRPRRVTKTQRETRGCLQRALRANELIALLFQIGTRDAHVAPRLAGHDDFGGFELERSGRTNAQHARNPLGSQQRTIDALYADADLLGWRGAGEQEADQCRAGLRADSGPQLRQERSPSTNSGRRGRR